MDEVNRLTGGHDRRGRAICAWIGPEILIERTVLFDDEDNMLDVVDVARNGTGLGLGIWARSLSRQAWALKEQDSQQDERGQFPHIGTHQGSQPHVVFRVWESPMARAGEFHQAVLKSLLPAQILSR